MGVTGLWNLLGPVGRPVPLESLENKVLAVDVSIWLNQALKGFRDSEGRSQPNAHLLGIFHRVCKLLFFKIKPIFVFDGAVPILKKQIIAARQRTRQVAKDDIEQIAQKILANQLAREVISSTKSSSSPKKISNKKGRPNIDDIFVLPPLPEATLNEFKDEEDYDSSNLSGEGNLSESVFHEYQNLSDIDITSSDFNNLPLDIRHEIISEIRNRGKKHFLPINKMPTESQSFSRFQLERLLKRRDLQSKLETIEKVMMSQEAGKFISELKNESVAETKKVASEDATHTIYIKTVKKGPPQIVETTEKKIGYPESTKEKDEEIKSTSSTSFESSVYNEEAWMSMKILGVDNEIPVHDIFNESGSFCEEQVPVLDVPNSYGEIFRANISQPEVNARVMVNSSQTGKSVEFVTSDSKSEESSLGFSHHSTTDNNEPSPKRSIKNNLNIENSDEIKCDDDFSLEKNPKEKLITQKPKIVDLSSPVKDNVLKIVIDIKSLEKHDDLFPSEIFETVKDGNKIIVCDVEAEEMDFVSSKIDSNKFSDTSVESFLTNEALKPVSISINSDIKNLDEAGASSSSVNNSSAANLNTKSTMIENVLSAFFKKSNASIQPSKSIYPLNNKVDKQNLASNKQNDFESCLVEASIPNQEQEKHSADQLCFSGYTEDELNQIEDNLEIDTRALIEEQGKQERIASTVTEQIYQESQELLKLFGVPYINSPTEAEAQCAQLELLGLTQGTITDDSDIWLFGGQNVYKNFFTQGKYLECFKIQDIKSKFGLDRSKLACFALLTGSDYTEGINGVGYVRAMEILSEFKGDGFDVLKQFKNWWQAAKDSKKPPGNNQRAKLTKLELSDAFPNLHVYEAYLKPTTDTSKEKFSWGIPDLYSLRELAKEKFGWTQTKADEMLLPVLKKLNDNTNQTRIDSYFAVTLKRQQEIFPSKRLKKAVAKLNTEGSDTNLNQVKRTKGRKITKRKKKTTVINSVNLSESSAESSA